MGALFDPATRLVERNARNLPDTAYALTVAEIDGPGGTSTKAWTLGTTAIPCNATQLTATERVQAEQVQPGANWRIRFVAGTRLLDTDGNPVPRLRLTIERYGKVRTIDVAIGPADFGRTMTRYLGAELPPIPNVSTGGGAGGWPAGTWP